MGFNLKIVLVAEYVAPSEDSFFGGLNSMTINFAKNLAKENSVHIITSFTQNSERIEQIDNITIHRVGPLRNFTQRGDLFKRFFFNIEVVKKIVQIHPDIIDAIGIVAFSCSYKGAKKIGKPIIATVLEVWQGSWIQNMGYINGIIGELVERYIFTFCKFDGYIAISNFTGKKVHSYFHIPEKKIKVIYCGVDTRLYDSIFVDKKFTNPTILTISRIVKYKQIDDLVLAVNILKTDFPNVRLLIIGEGPYQNKIKSLVLELKLENNVIFCGKITKYEELIKIFKRSHVFAFASVTEGFGIVLIESIAAKIPYVISDIEPLQEVTCGGVGGFIAERRNPQEFAKYIKILLENESVYNQKISEMNGFVKKYDWGELSKELVLYFNEIIQAKERL